MSTLPNPPVKRNKFWWLWLAWLVYFAGVEGVGMYEEFARHKGDGDTFTHFVATQVPPGARVAMIAWLAYHFLVVHKSA